MSETLVPPVDQFASLDEEYRNTQRKLLALERYPDTSSRGCTGHVIVTKLARSAFDKAASERAEFIDRFPEVAYKYFMADNDAMVWEGHTE